jgi:hypothetical protein
MPVKGNQPELYAALEDWFTAPTFPHIRDKQVTTIEKRHGRIETRCLTATSALNAYLRWPDVQQALMLEKRVVHTNTGEVSLVRRYALTSLSPAQADPARLLTLWRDHWSIENRLHYPRDVWFGEDASRIWAGFYLKSWPFFATPS